MREAGEAQWKAGKGSWSKTRQEGIRGNQIEGRRGRKTAVERGEEGIWKW